MTPRRGALRMLVGAAACLAAPRLARAAIDQAVLQAAAAQADLHALLIWRQGEPLLQHYRRSRDKPLGDWFSHDEEFGPEVLNDMRSISKSVVSLLVGQAVGRGEMDVAAPVLDFYPDLAALRSGPQAGITLQHLLDMASGLQWNEGGTTYGSLANDETRLYWDRSPASYILDRPLAAPPGTRWNYNGGCTVLLAEVLQQRSGRKLVDLAQADIFKPLGIEHFEWRSGLHGQPLPYAGLRLTPPDLLKIGRLMLDAGQWQGHQIVPAAWVAATLQPRISIDKSPLQYGHQWWAGTAEAGGRRVAWIAGFGNGGQRLFVVPALDLAVVMTAGQYNSDQIGPAQMRLFRQIVAAL
jgi:CubicO group peptidase (beta-lactamase class C family)